VTHVDFGRHSDDYAAYRPGPPPSFYRRIGGITPIRGARVLDVATGPGTIALELAARGATVVGLDTARRQILTARRVARERSLESNARFTVARAERTGLATGMFDLVTAGQCWHWFDRGTALQEARRVLRADGVLAIVQYSYLAEHAPVAHETEELILQFNPSWTMAGWSGTFPEQIDEVIRGGLRLVEQFCYDHDVEFSHARWRGRMRTCNGVGSGGLPPADVERFDQALGDLLRKRYADPFVVTHRLWCVVAQKPS
jgi:SAM-dependent methyltransferase